MKKTIVLLAITLFILPLAVPAAARISVSGDVAARFQGLEADSYAQSPALNGRDELEPGFQDILAKFEFAADVAVGVDGVVGLELTGDTIELAEAYITLDRLFVASQVKIGKFDINYGEQVERGASHAEVQGNLLIGNSLVMPDASQTGIEFSSHLDRAGWSLALTNGSEDISFAEDRKMAFAAKIWGEISPVIPGLSGAFSYYTVDHSDVDSSADLEDNLFSNDGAAAAYGSVIDIDNMNLTAQDMGDSDISAWQLDIVHDLRELGFPFELAFLYGQLENGDIDYEYWSGEFGYDIMENFYLAARYSVLNFDGEFNGTTLDNDEIKRTQVGLGYWLADNTLAKVEYVDQDPDDNTDTEKFSGFLAELSVSF